MDHNVPIIFADLSDVPDLSWSWQNHQIVVFAPDLWHYMLPTTTSTIDVRLLHE